MRLTPMRYKDYTWPHNPEVYTVEYQRRIAAHQVPCGGSVLQDLGCSYRVLRGEGVFAGEGAYQQFQKLAEVSGTPCLAGGAGLVRFPDGEGGAAAGLRAVQLRVLGGLERL